MADQSGLVAGDPSKQWVARQMLGFETEQCCLYFLLLSSCVRVAQLFFLHSFSLKPKMKQVEK
jgi:hypothetical protein